MTAGFRSTEFWHSAVCGLAGLVLCAVGLYRSDTLALGGAALLGLSTFAGEYWIAFQHSSTTATANSNVTLLSVSKLQQQWPVVTVGRLGSSITAASSGPAGIGIGIASAVTTNNTMAASVISASTQPLIYFVMSNV